MVLYDSRFGDTERVAFALGQGLEAVGVGARVSQIREVDPRELTAFDLIALGGPTHHHGLSDEVRAFLARLAGLDLKGRAGFAFDTRYDRPGSGSAARQIELALREVGLTVLRPYVSALVRVPEGRAARPPRGHHYPVLLEPGSEAAFQQLGAEIGRAMIRALADPPVPA